MLRSCPSGSVTEKGTAGPLGWREYPSGSHQSGGSSTMNTPTRLSLASDRSFTSRSSVPPRHSTSAVPTNRGDVHAGCNKQGDIDRRTSDVCSHVESSLNHMAAY